MPTPSTIARIAVQVLLATAAGAASAQYKVVASDGSVTYTDRPPSATNVRVTPMGRNVAAAALASGAGADTSGLPIDLRQAVARYPVTLYTAAECPPCDNGRKLLQQRGIPFAERQVGSDDDAQALERVVGGRTVPALSVGAQPLRGFSETDWAAYLDAAGYPRESKLPRNWPAPAPTPLVERAVVGQRAAPAAPPPAEIQVPELPGSTIRF